MISVLFLQCTGVYIYFFFFQAEDGIRDVAVTGVQTCALPIYVFGPYNRAMLEGQIERIAQTYGIRLLLQFGSTVGGATHPRSDVDLAVLVERDRKSVV